MTQYYSQVGQDRFLHQRFFAGRRGGTFVDIGAYDGRTFSNSLFFEESLGWTGLCVEPLPSEFAKLAACRTATCVNGCVADYEGFGDLLDVDAEVDAKMLSGLVDNYDPRHLERIQRFEKSRSVIRVPVTTFSGLLDRHGIRRVDYCSIDTEGSELRILQSLDFDRFEISVFSIENNYRDSRIRDFMASKGYAFVAALEGYDEVYRRPDVPMAPQTTVVCAVWHRDPDRHALLAGHAANLDAQTRPIERVYVFDGGDTPPPGLTGRVITSAEPLSIYQAWSLGFAAAATQYAMNLNLDDRLAPDGVEVLETVIDRGGDLVGADWRICYSQAETDAVTPAFAADDLAFVPDWPPAPGTPTRLGSGTGLRGTFGPACMWRTELHRTIGRFPDRFGDGTPIRTIGDAVWWRLLAMNKKTLQRIPRVIGNYHSHPGDQAEFRHPAVEEERILKAKGVRLMPIPAAKPGGG